MEANQIESLFAVVYLQKLDMREFFDVKAIKWVVKILRNIIYIKKCGNAFCSLINAVC